MESHRYKYSVVKMASRLDVSVRSYYDYRNGVYLKRSLYMHRLGLKSRLRRRYRVSTTHSNHSNSVAPNLLDRDFTAYTPGSKWVSDITYIRRIGGFDYFTTVMDLFDRKIIGWSFSSDMTDDHTTIAALRMALKRRNAHPDGLLFHSDRGVQYTSSKFVKLLKDNRIAQSMSGKGNCWDNMLLPKIKTSGFA